jgi:hypothetical protein
MIWADKLALLWWFVVLLFLNVIGQSGSFAQTYGTAGGWWTVFQISLLTVLPVWIILRIIDGLVGRRRHHY